MAHFSAKAKAMRPTPRTIRVTGQGNGKPMGLGFCKIIRMESRIRRAPEITKHTFASVFMFASNHNDVRASCMKKISLTTKSCLPESRRGLGWWGYSVNEKNDDWWMLSQKWKVKRKIVCLHHFQSLPNAYPPLPWIGRIMEFESKVGIYRISDSSFF